MKKLLLIALLLFVSFVGYSQSYGGFEIILPRGTTGKAVVKFTNGTTEVGIIKENGPVFGFRYEDPLEVKFKSNTDTEYRLIPSNEISFIRVHEKRNEAKYKDFYPIRVRSFDKKYTFSDQYYVSFYPKENYNGIDYVTINTFFNRSYIGNSYFFAVAEEGYYFYFDEGFRRKNSYSAQIMMLLDKNCEAFQEYVKHNYLETNNYKADYKAAVKEFRQNKKVFINERKKEGYKIRYAKMMFESEEYHIYFKQLIDKYVDLCPKEGN